MDRGRPQQSRHGDPERDERAAGARPPGAGDLYRRHRGAQGGIRTLREDRHRCLAHAGRGPEEGHRCAGRPCAGGEGSAGAAGLCHGRAAGIGCRARRAVGARFPAPARDRAAVFGGRGPGRAGRALGRQGAGEARHAGGARRFDGPTGADRHHQRPALGQGRHRDGADRRAGHRPVRLRPTAQRGPARGHRPAADGALQQDRAVVRPQGDRRTGRPQHHRPQPQAGVVRRHRAALQPRRRDRVRGRRRRRGSSRRRARERRSALPCPPWPRSTATNCAA